MTSYIDPLDAIRAAKDEQAESLYRGLTITGAGQHLTTARLRDLAGLECGADTAPVDPGMNNVLRAYQRNDWAAADKAAARARFLHRPTTGDAQPT